MSDTTVPFDGDLFKAKEKENTHFLPAGTRAVIRLDGKNFSAFTKQYEAPYDFTFMELIDEVTRRFVSQVPGAHFAYTQSDEISVVFSDLPKQGRKKGKNLAVPEMWFAGKLEKMLTIGAATVTALFTSEMKHTGEGPLPIFDARIHSLDDAQQAEEYVRWRRADAQKNSVTMAAGVLFSHSQLKGVSSKQRHTMLEGTDFETLPEGFFNGRITYREAYELEGIQNLKPTTKHPRGKHEEVTVTRHRWVTEPATREFMEGKFLELNQ